VDFFFPQQGVGFPVPSPLLFLALSVPPARYIFFGFSGFPLQAVFFSA